MKYYSFNEYLKNTFNQKIYKISLNAGFTCPNRDGKIDTRGCIFCSKGGSGDFAESPNLSITEQIEQGKKRVEKKIKNGKYIAYFQAFTNTYAPAHILREKYFEAVIVPPQNGLPAAQNPDHIDSVSLAHNDPPAIHAPTHVLPSMFAPVLP